MLSVEILCVGKLNQKFYKDGCNEYLKRISAFAKVKVTELAETRLEGDSDFAKQKVIECESNKMLDYIAKKNTAVVALCVEGKAVSSEELAAYFQKTAMHMSDITFLIGGSLGLSDTLKKRADFKLSMSAMTFPHQLARLVLTEQIYRAFAINNNIKYHK